MTPAASQLDFELPPSNTAPQLTGQVPPGFAGLTALRRWALPRMNLQVGQQPLLVLGQMLHARLAVQRCHAVHSAVLLHWLYEGV